MLVTASRLAPAALPQENHVSTTLSGHVSVTNLYIHDGAYSDQTGDLSLLNVLDFFYTLGEYIDVIERIAQSGHPSLRMSPPRAW